MKRTVYSIAIGAFAIILSATTVSGQGTQLSAGQQKQKEAELQKKIQTLTEEEQQRVKQAELDAKKRIISEEDIQKKIAEIEAAAAAREMDFEWQFRNAEELRKHADKISKELPVMVVPDGSMLRYGIPDRDNVYIFSGTGHKSKPGSSWNYSRQVMEATFTNEFTMSAADESSVNLSVSGDCAEGSMIVAIIMPDGKQLSEVILDENGSLNWRKNFEAGENNGWKNGKWVFKIKAREATGNLHISMSSN